MKTELVWNVYVGDFNSGKIRVHNVFNHSGFLDDCKKAAKKFANDRQAFEDAVQCAMMYL